MVAITRSVSQLTEAARQVLEGELGEPLRLDQQIRIQVLEGVNPVGQDRTESWAGEEAGLPDWCDVYKGMNDEEIAAVEAAILERNKSSRSFN
jgi:hypothetical protein